MKSALLDYLQTHLSTIQSDLELDALALYERNDEAMQANLLVWRGERPREVAPFGVSPIGKCAQSGEGTHLEIERAKPDKYNSQLFLPLSYENHLLGVLSAFSCQPGFFRDLKRVSKVKSLANHLAELWARPK